MTDPNTLEAFIKWGAENYPANRMCLILWDHGGGSVSGYGYDQKYKSSGAMSSSWDPLPVLKKQMLTSYPLCTEYSNKSIQISC